MAKTMANKYAGPCADCGAWVPAGLGIVTGTRGVWRLTHHPRTWHQWGVTSGGYLYGCPEVATRKARTVQAVRAEYALQTDAGKIGCVGLEIGAALNFRRDPVPGFRVIRQFTFESKPACLACRARPASEGFDYCRSPQCIAGREHAAERAIKATFKAA